ncbi:Chorismate mutase AroH [bioreactor metagenome]|uniref:Chorismate mutase AroH n=1 Tax=bioreactor metagenome TaxID=1076179 RepID=A0A644T8N3_9ZZZZ|nr:chorismate mutase [Negativicutes bacterium]
MLRGIRGATTVTSNSRTEILDCVSELLHAIKEANSFQTEDVGAIIFSSTPDLDAAFPAAAARSMGWTDIPLFGTQEIDNQDGLPRCIRVLILWNTDLSQNNIRHVYLGDAVVLRQDIAK